MSLSWYVRYRFFLSPPACSHSPCHAAHTADNTQALTFYAKAGYTPDEIDPTRIAEEGGWEDVDSDGEQRRPDYRILSKPLV